MDTGTWDYELLEAELVDETYACPACGERQMDELVWDNNEAVTCQTCGKVYRLD